MVGARRVRMFSGVGARGRGAPALCAGLSAVLCCTASTLGQTGACCRADGSCTLGDFAQCDGVYQGNGTSCATAECPEPMGACCAGSGSCTRVTRAECQLAGSIYIGDMVACGTGGAGTACPVGACCLSDGTCTGGLSQMDCTTLGGAFRGPSSTCASVMCPIPVGACCTGSGCGVAPADLCGLLGGTWRGRDTACGAGGACPALGVCCRGATCAANVGQPECVPPGPGVGARFVAGQQACNASGSRGVCCWADFNASGTISAQDVFDYLGAWFAGSPYCHVGGDGVTAPSNQDIFTFLAAWFAGC